MCDGVYQLVFLSPEALLSNETWRDTVPSPVYQENLVAVDSCHVTLGSNVTNYIPLWNENLAHVTRRIFPALKRGIIAQTLYSYSAVPNTKSFLRPCSRYLSLQYSCSAELLDLCH